jgi:hypothetical protein
MKYDLETYAQATIKFIVKGLNKTNLNNSIFTSLIEDADKFYVEVEEERVPDIVSKMHFEILCFASYWTSYLIVDYVTTTSFFKKKVDIESAQIFYKYIRKYLKEVCISNKFDTIYDLGVKSISPSIEIGPTVLLNSDNRLNQYENAALKGNSEVFKIYSKHLAMTFALEKYPLFEPITYTFIEQTIRVAKISIKGSFEL